MAKPVFLVDFSQMLEWSLVLLAREDSRTDSHGRVVHLKAGMRVSVYMYDTDTDGHPDNLFADGIVEENRSTGWRLT